MLQERGEGTCHIQLVLQEQHTKLLLSSFLQQDQVSAPAKLSPLCAAAVAQCNLLCRILPVLLLCVNEAFYMLDVRIL